MWGKERVVLSLLDAGRASGIYEPRLVLFTPSSLGEAARGAGFAVTILEPRHRQLPLRAVSALCEALAVGRPALVHTHGYKANIVGRLARLRGAPMRALVATCHGWPDETRTIALYNALDRRSAFASDVTTVPAEAMLALFPPSARTQCVANGLADREVPSAAARADARARFGFPDDRLVVGFLGRTSAAKGVGEFLESARTCATEPYLWAIAGTGDLDGTIANAAIPGVLHVGHVADGGAFLDAIDIFVQSSHTEALSLALLEAMRAGRPIVATNVGSTSRAIRDGIDGTLIPVADAHAMVDAVRSIANDHTRATALGASARSRFVNEFRIDRQQRAFEAIYRRVDRGPAATKSERTIWRRGGSNS